MRRSGINSIMRQVDAFIREHGFYLPPFAYLTPEEWGTKGEEVREIEKDEPSLYLLCNDYGQYLLPGGQLVNEKRGARFCSMRLADALTRSIRCGLGV